MAAWLALLLMLIVPAAAAAQGDNVAEAGTATAGEASEGGRLHRVQAGETLWQIAEATVGDPTLWPALYLANRDQIKDPSRVYPGQELAIPEIDPARAGELRREAATLNAR